MTWILLAVSFAAIWIYALYREDLRNPEPIWMVLLATGAGAGAFFLASWLELRLLNIDAVAYGSFAERARGAFFGVGPIEEGSKLLMVLILVWPWTDCDEPVDGIIYAAAAGAGFALVENLQFMRDDPAIILSRGPGGTAAHVLFSALWGGALGYAGHLPLWCRPLHVGLGLALAAIAHGAFDLITFSATREISVAQARALQIALFVLCLAFLRFRLKLALSQFPFRYRGVPP